MVFEVYPYHQMPDKPGLCPRLLSGLQSVGSVDDVDYPSVRFGDERCDPSLPRPTGAHQITPTSVRADWREGSGTWDNLHRFILPTDCNPVIIVRKIYLA